MPMKGEVFMKFIILHVTQEKDTTFITGCFARVAPDSEEREMFEMLTDCIEQVNNMSFRTKRVVRKDNTIYFRGIEARHLFTALKYWNDNLFLHLSIKLGKNTVYSGENARQALEDILSKEDFLVIRA